MQLSIYSSSIIRLFLFFPAKNMRGEFRKDKLGTSHSGREKRPSADIGQVKSCSRGMIRDVGSVHRFASSSFLSQRVGGKKPKSVRVMNYRLACAYVRAYWSDAPRVTHTCVARSLRNRVEYNKKEREKDIEGEGKKMVHAGLKRREEKRLRVSSRLQVV